MVALDRSELDETLIKYVANMIGLFEVEHVTFFHVVKSLDLSAKLAEKYPSLQSPIDSSIKEEISGKVAKHFKGACKYDILLQEGNPAQEILNWSDIREIDLMVVGRKLQLRGRGILPGKLVRTAHCSVLFVPENFTPGFKKVMVPIDFSKNASLALGVAKKFKEMTGAEITLQNSYQVPWGYHTTGKSFEEFAEIMKQHAQEDATDFLRKNDISPDDVNIILTLDEKQDPAERAYEEATKQNIDLIIMSSRGRTAAANFLMGSVSSKMIQLDANIPLLIAKNKGENMSFFEALMKI